MTSYFPMFCSIRSPIPATTDKGETLDRSCSCSKKRVPLARCHRTAAARDSNPPVRPQIGIRFPGDHHPCKPTRQTRGTSLCRSGHCGRVSPAGQRSTDRRAAGRRQRRSRAGGTAAGATEGRRVPGSAGCAPRQKPRTCAGARRRISPRRQSSRSTVSRASCCP